MLACDFFITVTVRFRVVDVFVVLEVGTRRIVHWNVTEPPTEDWTIQESRPVMTASAGAARISAGQADTSKLKTPAALTEQTPGTFKVDVDLSKGPFVITVHRDWAPIGADRFYNDSDSESLD